MFEEVTFETVLDQMLDRIDDTYDKRESSPIYAALAPAALEIVNIYAALGDMMEESFADTASREYLVRLAASRGMVPKEATKAILLAEVLPAEMELERDMEFTSEESIYRVLDKIGDGAYRLECKEAGEVGNLYTGQILPVDYIAGLESAVIKEVLVYGEEEEETEEVPAVLDMNEELLQLQNDRSMELKKNVREFAEQNAEISAQLLKNWLNGGAGDGGN